MNFPHELFTLASLVALTGLSLNTSATAAVNPLFDQAEQNGLLANEALRRSQHYVEGWLALADPKTGLIPRNKRDRFWNAKDTAADNYPFMVLTTSFTDPALFNGRMLEMLQTEIALTSRIGVLPDTYDFAKQAFADPEPDLNRILFGASEYIKDGLLPLTEWLGPSPWSARMIDLLDGMWAAAPVETRHGPIVSTDVEVNGEMLQTLSRVYWMTGDAKYLEWAIRLGDYYLLGDHHPTRDLHTLRLRDHGCEIISGLCELYATVHFAQPDKQAAYKAPLYEMLDRVLEVGRNEHSLFYDNINPIEGKPIGDGLADTWGYTYNGLYTVYLIDGHEPYRTATIKALSHLNEHYRNYAWERDSSDGYADSIESALNLYNREPLPSVAEWIDSEIQVMWGKQSPDGVIEGWHGDGNFARTSIMYKLWKSQGARLQPWRPDLILGAVAEGERRFFTIKAKADYRGTLHFDSPRHRSVMGLPLDWPRINQFQEWLTIDEAERYLVIDPDEKTRRFLTGKRLARGLEVDLRAGQTCRIEIRPLP